MKTGFIGAGAMTQAMLVGALKKQALKCDDVWVTNKHNKTKLAALSTKHHIHTTYDLSKFMENIDLLIFSVKPKDAFDSIQAIKPYLCKDVLIISLMAGISTRLMEEMIGMEIAISRAMPNTSAAICKSATAFTFNPYTNEKQKQIAYSLFQSIGTVTEIPEEQLDLVTALSGSGPAYFYYLIEQMQLAAGKLGMDQRTAKLLIQQTLIGAGEMLITSPKGASALREDVTSSGGTTEAGLQVLQQCHVDKALYQCIETATLKAASLRKNVQQTITTQIKNA
ncbi:pyrroline-5-carboxylate reductase [Bacillus spongiae]|uniref:Pyrroline-5-carboxylate reductase n=1 Tax=Bacillus spongiae TaxID=2683610 RepID=A0ABU8HG70_9BACI